jgi:hypothetical protein
MALHGRLHAFSQVIERIPIWDLNGRIEEGWYRPGGTTPKLRSRHSKPCCAANYATITPTPTLPYSPILSEYALSTKKRTGKVATKTCFVVMAIGDQGFNGEKISYSDPQESARGDVATKF